MSNSFFSATNDRPSSPHSLQERSSPRLSHRGLTTVLIFMCLVPAITIMAMWQYLPPVAEGALQAEVAAEGLPPIDFYKVDYYKRPPYAGGELAVTNRSEQDWTMLNIVVNGSYWIYDTEPILAGRTVRYKLERFVSRAGARFQLQYNELKSVRIYARRPTRDRATFYHDFPTVEAGQRK